MFHQHPALARALHDDRMRRLRPDLHHDLDGPDSGGADRWVRRPRRPRA
jgi:hypothetical protein